MKTPISLAALLLITPCDAVQIKSRATMPDFPVDGHTLVQAAIQGLDMVPIKELMRETRTECRSDWDKNVEKGSKEDRCDTWDNGLWDEVRDVNEDLMRDGKRNGVDIQERNLYDPDFIITFVEAEYHDFVKEFKNHQDHIAKGIDYGLSQLQKELTKLGLAQIQAKIRGDDKKDDRGRDEGPDKYQCYRDSDQLRNKGRDQCTDEDRRDPTKWPSVCNDDWCGPRGCKEVDWEKCNDSEDGCDQRDMTPEERKAMDDFENKRDSEWENFIIGCYINNSQLAAQLADEMAQEGLTKDGFVEMFKEGANELVGFINDQQFTDVIGEGMSQINEILTAESNRLGVELQAGGLPDPAETAPKLAALARAEVQKEIDRKSMDNMALEMYRDIIQEAHNFEFELQHGNDFELERYERGIEEGVKELGLEVDMSGVDEFLKAADEELKGLPQNKEFQNGLKKMGEDLAHEAQRELNHLKK